jgi:hypothetical protein
MKFNVSGEADKLLYLLLLTDLMFIALHILALNIESLRYSNFLVDSDRGFAETFQYIKQFWIALLIGYTATKMRSPLYLLWSLLFCNFLVDDSFMLHEEIGGILIGEKLYHSFPLSQFGSYTLGQVVYLAATGCVFLGLYSIIYFKTNKCLRNPSNHLMLMLLVLIFFGGIVDVISAVLQKWKILLNIIEDGGEHIVISVMLWFTLTLDQRILRTQKTCNDTEQLATPEE